jgi:NADH-quinone oxidoreductase subunit L
MLHWLWLIPALPLLGFLVLWLIGKRLSKRGNDIVGVGSVGLSALVTLLIGVEFLTGDSGGAYVQTLWRWMNVAGFTPTIGFRLDALSLTMVFVATFVGFLIHLYSTEFMADDEGYSRYFAYMNLFVAAMCTLVLADNLLFLFLGWEGVGLCSYLLIGFWYRDPANGEAARKAFVVTRTGDVAFTIGLLLLFTHLGTVDIQALMQRAAEQWPVGSTLAIAAAALLLGGALGKSAQLPLQTWLPDAMAGPTPVSALIHAATMVTAGVYLIARTHVLYTLAPPVLTAVGVIGAATLLLAGFSALTQHDIKRVLAYSTISQIGYMFLALGVGAWSAAMFHFFTHAFFKALLFLSAGAVIMSLHHEHDIFKMGGLRKRLPIAFWTFLIGGASLAALPLVTAGFYSKDLILWETWASERGSRVLWAAGLVGALLTALYTFRVVFIAFLGEPKTDIGARPGFCMRLPLIVLAALSVIAGFVETPPMLGNLHLLSTFLHTVLPETRLMEDAARLELMIELLAVAASIAGVYGAYLLFQRFSGRFVLPGALRTLWYRGWGFDSVYDWLIVRPFMKLARINRNDFLDGIYAGLAWFCRVLYRGLSSTQDGRVRRYAGGVTAGAVIVMALAMWRRMAVS